MIKKKAEPYEKYYFPRQKGWCRKRRPASSLGLSKSKSKDSNLDNWSPRPISRATSTVSLADSQILSKFMDG